MRISIVFCVLLLSCLVLFSQEKRSVLFVGNSYTSVNSLPQTLKNLALSAGDTLVFDSNTPGGCTFVSHFTNAQTVSKIAQGGWDYVVLQEQSQWPSFTDPEVEEYVFPYAAKLDSLITAADSCTQTMFYMTWGRKNGDQTNCAVWPPLCTYEGMDSLLHLRYMMMAEDNDAEVSPVGAAWHFVRDSFPDIELYSSDESHPSVAGTYLAACTFYSVIFRKDPTLISSDNGLDAVVANNLRLVAKTVAFDSLSRWFVGKYDPDSDFDFLVDSDSVIFQNNSLYANRYLWDFGDGEFSTEINPSHSYSENGIYEVTLFAYDCNGVDSLAKSVDISVGIENFNENDFSVFPNPVSDFLNLKLSDSQQIESVEVFNVMNERCLYQKVCSNSCKINVQDLTSGLYFVRVVSSGNVGCKSIVVER